MYISLYIFKSDYQVQSNPLNFDGYVNMRPATHQNPYTKDNIKDADREKRGRSLSEEVKLHNFAKQFKS